MAAGTRLDFWSEDDSPETAYALDFMLRSIGVRSRARHPGSRTRLGLYYGNHPPRPRPHIVIARHPGTDVDSDLRALRSATQPGLSGATIPLDLVRAVRYLMLDLGNQTATRDGQDRVLGTGSLQSRLGILRLPLVNRCVLVLRGAIQRFAGLECVPLWPGGKVCAIALSHDVDEPDRRCFRAECLRRLQRAATAVHEHRLAAAARAAAGIGFGLARLPMPGQNFWLFQRIVAEEEHHGVRSTFFVAARSRLDPGADRMYDVGYRIGQEPYQRVLHAVAAHGFDIALHASYRAFQSAARLRQERASLERAAGAPVVGVRHHAWHLGPDPERTLHHHETVGFSYDSSLAFNDAAGFRRSVALPFCPYVHAVRRPIRTMQIPLAIMDAHILVQGQTAQWALDAADDLIEAVKQHQGVGALNWHIQTALPLNREYRRWGMTYRDLLARLAADSSIWVTSLSEIHAHTCRRWAALGYA